ncbi:fluoride efflux transporter CrcB [Salipaludibacillus aurantiacus]|uniref:Fluoride-specific ion channel FluC n=1 Tax=Salipaludibacillus aurantiacus TaxID=1601833 RepID=A0A1H9WRU8_9BACI|nr:fluoride efflux transporter CrcB [Salipaludibacillus aurantiacus]SES36638.1 CrcB protein [Salipaludibacillus aurantiacus]
MNVFLVALGGGAGAVGRYLLGLWIKDRMPQKKIPTAMLFVNLTGSLGLGLFFGFIYNEVPILAYNDPLFLLVGIGFFGAFTTFSTFSIETSALLQKKKWPEAALYTALTIGGSIAVFLTGMTLMTLF